LHLRWGRCFRGRLVKARASTFGTTHPAASLAVAVAAFGALGLQARLVFADAPMRVETQVPLFTIAKSENRNQVQYAIRVDELCRPSGQAPVFAYWRMREKGSDKTEPLLPQEIDAYGIALQTVVGRDPTGGRVRLVLKAVRSREIAVETRRLDSAACMATATVRINGADARLFNVYAKLKWPFGVDYLMLRGFSLDGTRVVSEKLGG